MNVFNTFSSFAHGAYNTARIVYNVMDVERVVFVSKGAYSAGKKVVTVGKGIWNLKKEVQFPARVFQMAYNRWNVQKKIERVQNSTTLGERFRRLKEVPNENAVPIYHPDEYYADNLSLLKTAIQAGEIATPFLLPLGRLPLLYHSCDAVVNFQRIASDFKEIKTLPPKPLTTLEKRNRGIRFARDITATASAFCWIGLGEASESPITKGLEHTTFTLIGLYSVGMVIQHQEKIKENANKVVAIAKTTLTKVKAVSAKDRVAEAALKTSAVVKEITQKTAAKIGYVARITVKTAALTLITHISQASILMI